MTLLEHDGQPTSFYHIGMAYRGRSHALTPGDRRWLSSAHERLSAEIALVDGLELFQARAAVQREIDRLRTGITSIT